MFSATEWESDWQLFVFAFFEIFCLIFFETDSIAYLINIKCSLENVLFLIDFVLINLSVDL